MADGQIEKCLADLVLQLKRIADALEGRNMKEVWAGGQMKTVRYAGDHLEPQCNSIQTIGDSTYRCRNFEGHRGDHSFG